jgi:tripartite-type tricarboxylate transporter receptor subunit TctC
LNAALVTSANAPDLNAKLAADGGEGVGTTSEEFARRIATEIARWRKLVKDTGMSIP